MELTESAMDYANAYRNIMRQRDKLRTKEKFGRWAFQVYGDLVGEDPWTFLENMTESLAWKFAREAGIADSEYQTAVEILLSYSAELRPGVAPMVKCIERIISQKNPGNSDDFEFIRAWKKFPKFIGGLDEFQHKTVSDLVWLARHELDLYEEGEETDIHSPRHAQRVRDYIKMFSPPR